MKRSKHSKPDRLYLVSKMVMASSIAEALRKEKRIEPEDCRLAPQDAQPRPPELEPAVGFTINTRNDEDDE